MVVARRCLSENRADGRLLANDYANNALGIVLWVTSRIRNMTRCEFRHPFLLVRVDGNPYGYVSEKRSPHCLIEVVLPFGGGIFQILFKSWLVERPCPDVAVVRDPELSSSQHDAHVRIAVLGYAFAWLREAEPEPDFARQSLSFFFAEDRSDICPAKIEISEVLGEAGTSE